MDIQRAIDNLAHMKCEVQDSQAIRQDKRVRIETIEVAITAMKKQVKKEPDENACCALCNTYLKDDNGVEGNYCPNCGQKIEW